MKITKNEWSDINLAKSVINISELKKGMSPSRLCESGMLFSDAGLEQVVLQGGLVNQQIWNLTLGRAQFVQSTVGSCITGVHNLEIWNKYNCSLFTFYLFIEDNSFLN